jgi:IS30 family transposase
MSPVATLVERTTRFLMVVALPDGHRAELVADALAAKIQTLPAALARTLTWDQGHEMAEHTRFTMTTGMQVYFCDPKEPLAAREQREHQWSAPPIPTPHGEHADYTQADLDAIADELNNRPRQTLKFATPSEQLTHLLR